MALREMTKDTLRGDMHMLEQGINLSNRAKKENCLAKVGASIALGIQSVDGKAQKRNKALKHFLRRKRGVIYHSSPSTVFARSKLNQTQVDNKTKPPCILWTVELKFYATEQSNSAQQCEFWRQGSPIAEAVLNGINENTSLATLLSSKFLVDKAADAGETFALWITDAANKEDGGRYSWDDQALQVAIKRQTREEVSNH